MKYLIFVLLLSLFCSFTLGFPTENSQSQLEQTPAANSAATSENEISITPSKVVELEGMKLEKKPTVTIKTEQAPGSKQKFVFIDIGLGSLWPFPSSKGFVASLEIPKPVSPNFIPPCSEPECPTKQ